MRLLHIGGWHASAALLKIALELFEGLLLHRRGLLQCRGNGLTSQIVLGWSQATCGQNDVNALQGAGKPCGEHGQTVTDNRDPLQLDPQRWQPRRQPGGVRIRELTHEQFRTNREDFGFHAYSPWVSFCRRQQHPGNPPGFLAAQRTEGPTVCQENVTGPCGIPLHRAVSCPRAFPLASVWYQCYVVQSVATPEVVVSEG